MADPASQFLTQSEKEQIQTNYERILMNMKEKELLLALHSAKFISVGEKSDLDVKTPGKVREYIIDEVLMKATYPQIKSIREILRKSPTPVHAELAKLLPLREEGIEDRMQSLSFHEPMKASRQAESSPHIDYFPSKRRASDQMSLNAPVQETKFYHSDDNGDTSDSDELQASSPVYRGAGPGDSHSASSPGMISKGIAKLRNSFRKTKNSKSSPDVRLGCQAPLGCYGVKNDNNPVYGNSVCFVIVNFTDDLTGYQKDAADIVDFHKKRLKCDKVFEGKLGTLSMRDLTKEKFMDVLRAIQDFLKNPISGADVDRFFLYILSHGDEDGIMMCKEGSTMEEQGCDAEGKPIRVQMQDIVDMFTHDQVQSLKTFPKVFINQSCQGTELLRAAGPTSSDTTDSALPQRLPWKPPSFKLAVGADVIICDATSHDSMSWVSEGGSVFIQTLLEVMYLYLYDEHFYDILVEVNNKISHKMKKGRNPTDNRIVPASQMPKIHSQLTQKFFLAIPNQKSNFY